MKRLEDNRPALASAIMSLPWVADGIEENERQALRELVNFETLYGTESAPALVDKPWITEGVDELGVSVMIQLRILATYDEVSAASIARMPFLDTLETIDVDTLGALADLGRPVNWRGLLRALVGEPWVEDGLDQSEIAFVQALRRLTNTDEALASAVMDKPWITDGLDETEARVVQLLESIARDDKDIALRLVAAPFLETIGPVDSAAVATLRALGTSSQATLRAVVERPWVEDGLDESETAFVQKLGRLADRDEVTASRIADKLAVPDATAVDFLASLAFRHQELLRSTLERPWVQDGLNESESEILKYLNWTALGGEDVALWLATFVQTVDSDDVDTLAALWALGAFSQDTLRAVLEMPWAEDGLDEAETLVVRNLGWLADRDEAAALEILGRPFLETVESGDGDAVRALQILGSRSEETLRVVLGLPWAEDGLNEHEAEFVGALGWLAERDEAAALQVFERFSTQPPRGADAVAVRVLTGLAAHHPELFRAVMVKPWVEDGLDERETSIAQDLSWLADKDEPAALQVLGMPFLQSIEPVDVGAVRALWISAAFRPPEIFQRIIAHPTLSGGVTDEWARVVTVLGGVSGYDADRIDVLLDPRRVSVEERVIDLPLAGTVTLAIVRTRPGAESVIMDFLEHSVRGSEAFMGAPLPTSRVTLHFDEAYRFGGAGLHFSTHIGMLSRYDVDDGSAVARDAAPIIAHEVGHFYWGGGKPWVVEGGASFLEAVSEHARTGQSIDAGGHPCTHAGNITQLEGQGGEGEFGCYYAFGERLLIDLYRNLGEDTFRRGFLDLYLRTKAGSLEIEDYRAAFTAVAPDRAADIDRITARWYEGAETPDAFVPDESPVNPRLPGLSGRIADAYVTTIGGLRLVGFSTRHIYDIWLQLRFIVNPESERRELSLSIEGYFEDGFAFWLREMTIPVLAGQTSGNIEVFRGAAPTYQWAPGRYVVYVYSEGQKVAEVEFEVVP